MCITNGWVLGNEWFERRLSHTINRYSWGGKWRSITDYIIMTKEIKTSVRYVKVKPSVNFDSDHRLLVPDFKDHQNMKAIQKCLGTTGKTV
jgi:hypothetical protein